MRRYHGKILLFGEYLVLVGGYALAIPSDDFYGNWSFQDQTDKRLLDVLRFIENIERDLKATFNKEHFLYDINRSLTFSSNIPLASGLGSSGALTAAIYDVYTTNKPESILDFQHDMAMIESYFHGQSSGFDPLVSYLDTALIKDHSGIHQLNRLPPLKFELIDSGIKRQGKDWINLFNQKLETVESFKSEIQNLVDINNRLVDSLGKADEINFDLISNYAHIQLSTMEAFFVPKMAELAKIGIKEDQFAVKLCGAGGGGYYLKFLR